MILIVNVRIGDTALADLEIVTEAALALPALEALLTSRTITNGFPGLGRGCHDEAT